MPDTGTGGWMWGLASALLEKTSITLGVATAQVGAGDSVQEDGRVTHYKIGLEKERFHSIVEVNPDSAFMASLQGAIDAFKPDLVHFHGSELAYGLLVSRGRLAIPHVLSLQGILNAYYPYYLGDLTFKEYLGCHSIYNPVLKRGVYYDFKQFRERLGTEKEILGAVKNFTGQTLWDRAYVSALNPKAKYFHADRALRSPFYQIDKVPAAEKQPTLFAIWGQYPLKGTHVLIRALAEVRKRIPTIKLKFAGAQGIRPRKIRYYSSFLDDLIREFKLEGSIEFLPRLNSDGMAAEMTSASAFILPSFIENESNSVMEAMLAGTPSIAAFVGGVPSTIANEETGLFFPPGDHVVLAEQIVRIVSDSNLAQGIADRARESALHRYDRDAAALRMQEIYTTIIQDKV